jgi:methanogenic corrinoid protein MtbC1
MTTEEVQSLYRRLAGEILEQDAERAAQTARELLAAGADPQQTVEAVIRPTADEIGAKFQREEFFLPQLMLAGQALEAAAGVLVEAIPTGDREAQPTVVIGTVQGDVHTIGKNIVAMMLRTGGFTVHDVGVDVTAGAFLRAAQEHQADLIACSSLLTTTLPYQRDVIEELTAQGLRDRFKVLIGGGPCTAEWAEQIGADGYAKDAIEALAVARRLVGTEE